LEPVDHLAFIGRSPDNERVYLCTGDSGQGMTHGAIAGLLLSDLIAKGESRFAALYDPARKTPGMVTTFIGENVAPLQKFAEYVAPGEIDSVDALKPGQGAIVREGLHKIAAYRDENGKLHRSS